MPHIVLLGDSTFDNQPSVRTGREVISQLHDRLGSGWDATLLAVDGAKVEGVVQQLSDIPHDATHLVLSVGGNDALSHRDVLENRTDSLIDVLSEMAEIAERFTRSYRALVRRLKGLQTNLTVCTIYHPPLSDPILRQLALTALPIFNDAILRIAFEEGLSVIDLRLVCPEGGDFVYEIEPSEVGGTKIAAAVARGVGAEPVDPVSCIFGVYSNIGVSKEI
jgi:hypothetical protein